MTLIKLLKFTPLFLFILFTFGCAETDTKQRVKIDKYYDLEGEIDQQLVFLDSLNPVLEKTVMVDGKKQSKRLKYDTTAWEKELNLFIKADINLPNLRDSYYQQEIERNGQKVLSYSLKDPEEDGIVSLEIFKDTSENIQHLKALYREKNVLYFSERLMTMSFEEIGNNNVLTKYEVDGIQKVIFKDTTKYYINSNITYN